MLSAASTSERSCEWPSCTLQILRSIDSDSADGFPSHQQEAMQMGLDSGKGKIIEYSIQKVCPGVSCIQV